MSKYADKDIDFLMKFFNAIKPDHPDYDDLLAHIQVRLVEKEKEESEAASNRNATFVLTEEKAAELKKIAKETQKFRRSEVLKQGDKLSKTKGAFLVEDVARTDPESEAYQAMIQELIHRAEEVNSNPAVKSFLDQELELERKRGQKVSRRYDETYPVTIEINDPISEQILMWANLLPADKLEMKRALTSIGKNVKDMEEREAKVRQLFKCHEEE